MSDASRWLLVARLLRPQGRKGELLADLFTDFPERFADHPEVWIAPAGFSGTRAVAGSAEMLGLERAEVSAHWLPVGRNAGRIVLHLEGVSNIEQAERFAGRQVVIPEAARPRLEDGSVYISDLVGATVFDGTTEIGTVEDVEFATSADGSRRLEDAAPLLSVRSTEGEEILVPFVSEYLVEMDIEARVVRMRLPEGLISVNSRVAGGRDNV